MTRTKLTNYELDSSGFINTVAVTQDINHMQVFGEFLTTLGLPVDKRPVMRRDVTLGEDMVGEVSEMLKLDALVQANALGRDLGSRRMDIIVREP